MSKQKARATSTQLTGLYKPDSVKDVAESLNITGLSDAIASALSSDVEYRIHQVVEEAGRFMRHARRTTMTTSDIDQALRVLNIEPLYGHFPHNPPIFRRAAPFPQAPSAGTVHFVEDEEIEFDRIIREEKITMPKGVNWTAHWLAVEGVQPLIPENPPAIPRDTDGEPSVVKPDLTAPRPNGLFPPTPPASDRPSPIQGPKKTQQQQLVKQVLSRELQLYYTRLTSSLLPPSTDEAKRTAALASLRGDAGLQALLPYLVRWVGEGVVNALKGGVTTDNDGRVLGVLLDVIGAILDNPTLFVEPYLHQLLPPTLSILLHSTLPAPHATYLRSTSAQILSHLLQQHSTTYPSLSPRIMKTILLGLISPGKSKGTREGSIRGLMGIGKEAIRKGIVESGGAKVVGSECTHGEQSSVVDAVVAALQVLHPPSQHPIPLSSFDDSDQAIIAQLQDTLGDFFAGKVMFDRDWASGILSGSSEAS